jgi:hypothetical protein
LKSPSAAAEFGKFNFFFLTPLLRQQSLENRLDANVTVAEFKMLHIFLLDTTIGAAELGKLYFLFLTSLLQQQSLESFDTIS